MKITLSEYLKENFEKNTDFLQFFDSEQERKKVKKLIDESQYQNDCYIWITSGTNGYPAWWFLASNEEVFDYFKTTPLAQKLFEKNLAYQHDETKFSSELNALNMSANGFVENILFHPYLYNYNINITTFLTQYGFSNEGHITYLQDNPEYYLQCFEKGLAAFNDIELSETAFLENVTVLKTMIHYAINHDNMLYSIDMIERFIRLGARTNICVLNSDLDPLKGNSMVIKELPYRDYIKEFAPALNKVYETKELNEKLSEILPEKTKVRSKKI